MNGLPLEISEFERVGYVFKNKKLIGPRLPIRLIQTKARVKHIDCESNERLNSSEIRCSR